MGWIVVMDSCHGYRSWDFHKIKITWVANYCINEMYGD